MLEYYVFFERNSDAITRDTARILDNAALQILNPNCGAGRVNLAGHTDRSGSVAHNLHLSGRRAVAAARYLERRGVPAALLVTQALGETQALIETRDGIAEPQNRNVQILLGPAIDQ